MSKEKFKYERGEARLDCSSHFFDLAEGLKSGVVNFRHGEQMLTLHPSANLEFKLSASRKDDEETLKLELTWPKGTNKALAPALSPSRFQLAPLLDVVESPPRDTQFTDREISVEEQTSGEGLEDASTESTQDLTEVLPMPHAVYTATVLATREQLYELAKESDLEGRSQLDKRELATELARTGIDPMTALSMRDLYGMAQQQDIAGRSTMDREQLIEALLQARDSQ